jgi:hypothetical protein
MIYEVSMTDVALPYSDDGTLCLGQGLLNPRCFHAAFKEYPWYPFEDFLLNEGDAKGLSTALAEDGKFYRQDMPCRDKSSKLYCIDQPDAMDVIKLFEWLNYYEGIIWTNAGTVIINSFSDYIIFSISERTSSKLFGNSVESIFTSSQSVFTRSDQSDPLIIDFMTKVRETWSHE